MPIRPPRNPSAGTVRDLGLPARAVTALTRAGITSVDDLAVLSRRELSAIAGLGPGSIAAIRLVVPEPPTGVRRPAAPPRTDHEEPPVPSTDPGIDPVEEDPPAPPVMPSFDSLRGPRRRSAVDLLVPATPPAPSAGRAGPTAGPRPPEWGDLLCLGLRVSRAVLALPVRVALRSVREPVHRLHRLLSG